MAENKTQDYFDDNDEGHVDTREANFKCEKIGLTLTLIVLGYFINRCIAGRTSGATCKL